MCAFACGCAEAPLDVALAQPLREESPPIQQRPGYAPPLDSFWLAQAVTEMHKPPLMQPHSISLGYVGNAPLTGGVMRATPMPAPEYMYDTQAAPPPATCSCELR